MKFRYLLILCVVFFPLAGQALTLDYDGCWEKESSASAIVLNMQGFECEITVAGNVNEQISFTVEHVDPDYFLVDNYDSITRDGNELSFTKVLTANEEVINISPWEELDDFYFVGMSDPQPDSDQLYDPTHKGILQQVDIINPYFTLIAGDLTFGSNTEAEVQIDAEGFLTVMEENLNTSWFTAVGNHDVEVSMDLYTDYFGSTYYSFDFGGAHFMSLSTEEDGEENSIEGTQYTWLQSDLANSSADKKIAYYHRPLVPPSWASYTGWDDPDQATTVAGLFDQNGVDLVLNGHSHGYDYELIDSSDFSSVSNGFYQLVSAGAGGTLVSGENHYVLVHVSDDGVEYEKIDYDSFYITKSTEDLNDGTEDEVTITVTNSGEIDWDWARTKFLLSGSYVHAEDQDGNYLDHSDYQFDDYHVVYVTSDIPAGTSKEITVKKNHKAHTGVTNTYNNEGNVSYSENPESSETQIDLEAQTSKGTAAVTVTDWEGKSWQEVASKKSVQTTYTVGDLTADYCYVVKVNDSNFGRYCADDDGAISFTYDKEVKNRTYEITAETDWYPGKVAVAPYSDGGAQVRMFNSNGKTLDQFRIYKNTWEGGFNLAWGDLDGDREGELITLPKEGNRALLQAFTDSGSLLAKKRVFSKDFKSGARIAVGDIDGNGKDEIVVAGPKRIKVYRYRSKKDDFKLITSKSVYGDDFEGDLQVVLGQVNDNDKLEILVGPNTGQGNLKIYKFTSSKLSLIGQEETHVNEFDGLSIAVGDINNKGRAEIAVAANGLIKFYRFTSSKEVKFVKKKRPYKNYYGDLDIALGDLNGKPKTELVVAPQGGQDLLKVYKFKSNNTFELLDKKEPYGEGYNYGMQVELVDTDDDCDMEIVLTPLQGSPNTRLYDFGTDLDLEDWWWAYDTDFTGGVNAATL